MSGGRRGRPLPGRRALDEEIRHHIEERIDRLVEEGVPADEARRRALEAFGDLEAVRGELARIDVERAGPTRMADRVRQDLSFARRQLVRSPGWAALAVLTLGLGIGSAAAIFGVVKAVVLEPLPYPEPHELVTLHQVTPEGGRFSVSVPDFADFRERVESFEAAAAFSRADFAFQGGDGEPVRLVAGRVTPGFFRVFGGEPLLGRALLEGEGASGPARVTVVSHRLWQGLLGGDEGVLGRSLHLDGVAHAVVGVMPAGWEPAMEADLWVPLVVMPEHADRGDHVLDVAARLADGVDIEAARAEAEAVAGALAREHPVSNEGWGVELRPLKEALVGPERIRAGWVLLGAVGLLLLMACASVSNLLVARATVRGREMALRAALGAGRRRMVQQLLTESLVLAGAGAAVGVALAWLGVPLLQAMSPPGTPRIEQAAVDGTVVLFSAGVAVLTGLLFGVAPAFHAARRDPGASLRSGARATGAAGERLRAGLLVGQVAVTVVLLAGAALLGASFLRMQGHDTGLARRGTAVVPLMLSGDRFTGPERAAASTEIAERMEAVPGVAAVGFGNIRPFSGGSTAINLAVEGRPGSPVDAPFVRWRLASRGWFDAARLEPVAGRPFGAADYDEGAEPVVVVSESLARRVLGGVRQAVGRRIAMGWDGTNWRRVVGVVPDVEDVKVSAVPTPTFYMPARGDGWPWKVFLVRMEDPDAPVPAAALRQAVWDVDPGLPVPEVTPLERAFSEAVAQPRFNLVILAVFGAVALALAVMGVYGLTLFSVRRRTAEIGIRMALGARPEGVVRMLLGRGIRVVVAGCVVGLAATLVLSTVLESLLFGTAPRDPWMLGGAMAVAAASALAATWIPATRATRVDPTAALAAE